MPTLTRSGLPLCKHTQQWQCTQWCRYRLLFRVMLTVVALFGVLVALMFRFGDAGTVLRVLQETALGIGVFLGVVIPYWLAMALIGRRNRTRPRPPA